MDSLASHPCGAPSPLRNITLPKHRPQISQNFPAQIWSKNWGKTAYKIKPTKFDLHLFELQGTVHVLLIFLCKPLKQNESFMLSTSVLDVIISYSKMGIFTESEIFFKVLSPRYMSDFSVHISNSCMIGCTRKEILQT